MDYRVYRLNLRQKTETLLKAAAASAVIAYLFYDCLWLALGFPLVYLFLRKLRLDQELQKRKRALTEQFLDMLRSMAAALAAGYAVENSIREANSDMAMLYGRDSYICKEMRTFLQGISVNIPLEKLFRDFAIRSGCEDIREFADVFQYAKRNSGNFAEIIGSSAERISGRYETEKEIEIAVASRKMEQKVMNAVPVFILAYLKLTDAEYLSVLYGNAVGIIFMTICLAAYGAALYLAEKINDIRV